MNENQDKGFNKTSINWYIPTYGKLLYKMIKKEVAMKKIGNEYTNNIFENIKHIDEYGNAYWYARDFPKF